MPFTSYGVSPLFYDRKEERREEGQKVKVLLFKFRLMQIQADRNSTNRLMLNEEIENAPPLLPAPPSSIDWCIRLGMKVLTGAPLSLD